MGNRPITHDELRALRRKCDVPENARLTLADVQRLSQEMCLQERVARPPPAHYLQQIFEKLDSARQGTISLDEFDAMVFQLQKLRQDRKSRGQAATPPPAAVAARPAAGGRARASTPPPAVQAAQPVCDGSDAGAPVLALCPPKAIPKAPSPARKSVPDEAAATGPTSVRPSLASRKSMTPPPRSPQVASPSLASRKSMTPPPRSPQGAAKWSPDEHNVEVLRRAVGSKLTPSESHGSAARRRTQPAKSSHRPQGSTQPGSSAILPRGMAKQCMEAEQIEVAPLDSPFTPSRQSEPMDSPFTPSRRQLDPSKEVVRKSKSKSPRSKSPRKASAEPSPQEGSLRSSFAYFSSLIGSSEGPSVASSEAAPRSSGQRKESRIAKEKAPRAQDTEDMASTFMEATTKLGESFSSIFAGEAEASTLSSIEPPRPSSPVQSSAAVEVRPAASSQQTAAEPRPSISSRGRRSVVTAIRKVEAELGPRRPSIASAATASHSAAQAGSTASGSRKQSPSSKEASKDGDYMDAQPASTGEGWHRPPPTTEAAASEASSTPLQRRRYLRSAPRASQDTGIEAGEQRTPPARRRHLRSTPRVQHDTAMMEQVVHTTSISPRPAAASIAVGTASSTQTTDAVAGDLEGVASDSDVSVSGSSLRPTSYALRPESSRSSMAAASAAPRRQSSLSPRQRTFSTSPRPSSGQTRPSSRQAVISSTGATQPGESSDYLQRAHQSPQPSRGSTEVWQADPHEPDELDRGSSDESITDFVVRSRGSKIGARQGTKGQGLSDMSTSASLPPDLWTPLGRHLHPDTPSPRPAVGAESDVHRDAWSGAGKRSRASMAADFQDWAATGIGPGSASDLIPSPRASSPVSVRSRSSAGSSKQKGTNRASKQRSSSHHSSLHRQREGRESSRPKRSSNFLDTNAKNPQARESFAGWLFKGMM